MRKEPEFRRAIVNHIFPFIASAVQIKPQKLPPTTQALRLGLLAGQALERSDNPVTIRRNVQPLRVGLSKSSVDSLIIKRLLCVLSARLKCLPLHSQGR